MAKLNKCIKKAFERTEISRSENVLLTQRKYPTQVNFGQVDDVLGSTIPPLGQHEEPNLPHEKKLPTDSAAIRPVSSLEPEKFNSGTRGVMRSV